MAEVTLTWATAPAERACASCGATIQAGEQALAGEGTGLLYCKRNGCAERKRPAQCIVGRLQPPGDRVVPRGEPICIEIVQRTCDFHPDGRSHDHWHVVTHYVGGRTDELRHYYDQASAACEMATTFGNEHGMNWDREAFPNGLVR